MIWPKRFSQIALLFIFIVLFIHYAFFPQFIIPFEILFFGIIVTILFFIGLNYFSKKWSRVAEKSFVRKLFVTSFLLKLVFFASTLLLIFLVDPKSYPYEIGGGADSYIYHQAASEVADGLFSHDLSRVLHKWYKERADFGYPTYLGFLYHFFGKDSILIRILSLFFSSLTVVFVFKLAKNIYGEAVGRFAGILTMLMPALLWYDTALLKESVMIFLIFSCLYGISEMVLSRKFRIWNIILAVVPIFLLFYFRAFLAWMIIFVAMIYFILNLSNRRISRPIVFISFMLLVAVLSISVVNSGSLEELNTMVQKSGTQLEDELISSAIQRGLSFNTLGIAPLLLLGSIVTPFPSLLYFDAGQLVMVSHFFNELVRNSLYFFAFLGIWISYKKRFSESSLILLYTLGYIFVLAVSGKSFQDRFQLPSLPGILILISVGLSGGRIHFNIWKFYLIAVGIG
ncbi:MAG: glycosyltransferase family 39 protein, partial [Proteobacteria bacterium]|nr:glycosyltransferase family 39 protein [Pseudomonadota bacterium]MBU1570641.1 glycosyltransferase family 39 protein [Pseudomonadota bacterium]